MANINSRVFGSDIPIIIKKKLEARQLASEQTREPGEQINPSDYPDDRTAYYKFEELHKNQFDGQLDLSSRTPFVRMWTAVDLARDNVIEGKEEMSEDEAKKWEDDKFEAVMKESGIKDYSQQNIQTAGNQAADEYKDKFLVANEGGGYSLHEWQKIGTEFKRIYQISIDIH